MGGRRNFKQFISNVLVLSFGIGLAYHFLLFWINGYILIGEPNKVLLLLETAMSFLIIAFALERFLRN